jgi:tumor protein p53-inducible protein 3
MKAVLIKKPGGREELYIGQVPTPRPKGREILVKVKATSLNRMDILQRQGLYPVPEGASDVLGVDLAGVVEETGPDVGRWKPGDRVMGLTGGGGYAEYAVIHEDLAREIPENLTFEEASAVPEVFSAAYQTLFWLGKVEKEQLVLVHAGAGGVGSAAIQLVRETGAKSFATAGTDEKVEFCKNLGANFGCNYNKVSFPEPLLEATGGKGADVILDFVGAPYWEKNIRSLKKDGRLIIIGFLGGPFVEKVDLNQILTRWVRVVGTTLRSRDLKYRTALAGEMYAFALPRFRDGRLKPVVDRVFSWEDVKEAHKYMEENRNLGKIVLGGM